MNQIGGWMKEVLLLSILFALCGCADGISRLADGVHEVNRTLVRIERGL